MPVLMILALDEAGEEERRERARSSELRKAKLSSAESLRLRLKMVDPARERTGSRWQVGSRAASSSTIVARLLWRRMQAVV